jgi:hypothetical protein
MKLKKIYILLFLFAVYTQFHSQMWVPATPFPYPWANSAATSPRVSKILTHNNEMYISGYFNQVGNIVAHSIAKWNGVNWLNVGVPNFFAQDEVVYDMEIFNGELWVTTSNRLYKWNGSSFIDFTYLFHGVYNWPIKGSDLHVFNNKLYIVLNIPNSGSGLMEFDGSNFIHHDDNFNISGTINSIEDFAGDIYCATTKGLFKFQNGNYINCTGISTNLPNIRDIETFNNELYAIGNISSIGGIIVQNIAKYDGNNWHNASPFQQYFPFFVGYLGSGDMQFDLNNYFYTSNNYLYIASSFNQPLPAVLPEISPVVKFDGTNWSDISINFQSSGFPFCLGEYNNELYCGGAMEFIYGPFISSYTDNLVKLNPTLTSIKENSFKFNYSLQPNPTSSEITINSDTFTNEPYTLYDQMGRTVASGRLAGNSTTLSLSNLSKGIYILKIEGAYESAIVVKE